MDFTKLLKHCEAEHGIKLDTSNFTDALLYAIYRYFDNRHGKTLLHTEQWDIFETLQEQPKPGSPPPIVAKMKEMAFENIENGEQTDDRKWGTQHGVLISNRDALKIVEFCERLPYSGSVIEGERVNLLIEILKDLKEIAVENLDSGQPLRPASWDLRTGVLLHNKTARDICDIFEELFKGVNAPDPLPDYGTGFRPDWSQIDTKYVACAADENGKIFFYPVIPKPTGENFWFYTGLRHLEYPYTAVNAPVENWRECLWIRPGHQQQ